LGFARIANYLGQDQIREVVKKAAGALGIGTAT
jgi:hypothetical protein